MVEIKAFNRLFSWDFTAEDRQTEFSKYFIELKKFQFKDMKDVSEWMVERQFEIIPVSEDSKLRVSENMHSAIPIDRPILFFRLSDAISLNLLGWIMIAYDGELDLLWNAEAPYLE